MDEVENFQSPIDLTHIRFEDLKTESNRLAGMPLEISQFAEPHAQLRKALVVKRSRSATSKN